MEAAEIAGRTDRRDEVLAAAATVMARMGFERMRLRDVATEAGVSIGLLQHYFETREQLGREAFASARSLTRFPKPSSSRSYNLVARLIGLENSSRLVSLIRPPRTS